MGPGRVEWEGIESGLKVPWLVLICYILPYLSFVLCRTNVGNDY